MLDSAAISSNIAFPQRRKHGEDNIDADMSQEKLINSTELEIAVACGSDGGLVVSSMSRAMRKLCGGKAAELPVEELLANVIEEESLLALAAALRESHRDSKPVKVRLKGRKRGGFDCVIIPPPNERDGKCRCALFECRDCDESKRVDRRRFNLLKAVIDILPGTVFAKDIEGRKILSNSLDAKIMGLNSPEEAVGKTDFEVFPKEQAQEFAREDKIVLSGGSVKGSPKTFTDKDGSVIYFLTSKVPLRDENGDIIGLVGASYDVTDLTLAQKELAESKKQLEKSNHKMQQLIEELQATNEEYEAMNEELIASNEEYESINDELIDSQKELISREKAVAESEEKYRRLLSSLTEYIYRININGNKVSIEHGPGSYAITGYTSDELSERPDSWHDFIHPEDRAKIALFTSNILNKGDIPSAEFRIITKKGEDKWVRSTVVPVRDSKGDVTSYDGLIQDITAEKLAKLQLEKAYRETKIRYEVSRSLATAETEQDVLNALIAHAGIYHEAFVAILLRDTDVPGYTFYTGVYNSFNSGIEPIALDGVPFNEKLIHVLQDLPPDEESIVDDAENDERLSANGKSFAARVGWRSRLSLPLKGRDGFIGYLAAQSPVKGLFSDERADLYRTLVELGVGAIKSARLRAAIRESEHRLSLLIEQSPHAVIESDLQGNVLSWNPAAERIFGYSKEEVLALESPTVLIREADIESERLVWDRLLTEKSTIRRELINIKKDGSEIICEWIGFPLIDDSGNIIRITSLVQDITDKKRAEERIARNLMETEIRLNVSQSLAVAETEEEILNVIISHSRLYPEAFVGIMILDNDEGRTSFTVRRIDPADSGIPPFAKIGDTLSEETFPVLKVFNPRDEVVINDIYTDHRVSPDLRSRFENIGLMSRLSLPLGKGPEFVGYMAAQCRQANFFDESRTHLFRTLAELGSSALRAAKLREGIRASEERLSMFVEQSPFGVIEWDREARVMSWNPAAERIFGYTSREIMGKTASETIVQDRMLFGRDMEWEGLLESKSSNTVTRPNRRKDGTEIFCEWNSFSLVGRNGEVVGVASIVQDISDRIKSEEEKKQLELQLAQAQKIESIGRLAGGVAHDFNNMLTVILGHTELLKLGLSRDSGLIEGVSEIEKAAIHSRDITRQLLAFSRRQIISPQEIDLNRRVRNIRTTLARLIGENIELKFRAGRGLWTVEFDPTQIDQIVVNLAVNSRDAMPNGGLLIIETRNVTVDDHQISEFFEVIPGDYVMLSVTDNGTGMDEDVKKNIFEPFFTTKEQGKGTGLGMATVYGMVRQNGGFVNVYSEGGKGTSVKVYIPRFDSPGTRAADNPEVETVKGTGDVLLVEDDPLVRRMAESMLKSLGYTVAAAQSPEEALLLLGNPETKVDLLITDVVMPGMSGSELSERAAKQRPGLSVLFMSGYTSDVVVLQGVLEDKMNFIQKPFSMAELAQKVKQAMK